MHICWQMESESLLLSSSLSALALVSIYLEEIFCWWELRNVILKPLWEICMICNCYCFSLFGKGNGKLLGKFCFIYVYIMHYIWNVNFGPGIWVCTSITSVTMEKSWNMANISQNIFLCNYNNWYPNLSIAIQGHKVAKINAIY